MKKKYHNNVCDLIKNFECLPGQIWLFETGQGLMWYCLITNVEKNPTTNPSSENDGVYHDIRGVTFDKRGFMFSEFNLFPLSINWKKFHMYWKLVA